MPRQTSVQLTEATERQAAALKAAGFGSLTDIIRIAIDRMYQQEIPTVTHKYNLSSNMSHRINFDQMVERHLADVHAAYGDEVGEWRLYFDLEQLDVDDEGEAIARIESIWPDATVVIVSVEQLGGDATDADAKRMVELLNERGYQARLGEGTAANVTEMVWDECLGIISQENGAKL